MQHLYQNGLALRHARMIRQRMQLALPTHRQTRHCRHADATTPLFKRQQTPQPASDQPPACIIATD
jgi:hypothetical protein